MHDLELVRTISCAECGLPFVAFGDADKVVGSAKVDFGEDACRAQAVEKVGNEGERVPVFLGDSIETAVVDRKAK